MNNIKKEEYKKNIDQISATIILKDYKERIVMKDNKIILNTNGVNIELK